MPFSFICHRCGNPFLRSARTTPNVYCSMECYRAPSLIDRFWTKVNKNGPIIQEALGPCWMWTGSLIEGYGNIRQGGRHGPTIRAHRLSWELANGPVPQGLYVLHRCDNRPCVNPSHLFVGTKDDNTADMVAKGRQSGPKGERNSHARLSPEQVLTIRSKYQSGNFSYRSLAKEFSVNMSTIATIVRGSHWKHLL